MRFYNLCAWLVLCCGHTILLQAAHAYQPSSWPVFTGEEIKVKPRMPVWPSRGATYSQEDLTHYSNSSSTPNLAPIVQKMPGVQLLSLGTNLDFSTLSIRGGSSAQTAVLVDGVTFNPASIGSVDLSTLPILGYDQVQVYRGAMPIELGPDGFLGGVLLKSNLRYGTHGLFHQSLGSLAFRQTLAAYSTSVGNQEHPFLIGIEARYAGQQGDFNFLNDNGSVLNPNDDHIQKRVNNDQNQGHIRFRLQHTLANHGTIKSDINWSTKEQGIAPPSNQSSSDTRYQVSRLQAFLNLEHYPLNKFIHYHFNTSFFNTLNHTNNPTPEFSYLPKDVHSQEYQIEQQHRLHYQLSSHYEFIHTLTGRWNNYNQQTSDAGVPQSLMRGLVGGAVLVRAQWLNYKINLETGGRLDVIWNQGSIAPSRYFGNERRNINQQLWLIQPSLGLNLVPYPWIEAQLHLLMRSRPPSLQELFGVEQQLRGNSELKQEHQWTVDAGIHFKDQRFFDLSVNYAETRTKNLITYAQNPQDLAQAINLNQAFIRTVELSAFGNVLDYADVSIKYTFLKTQQTTLGPQYLKPLPMRPEHQIFIETSLHDKLQQSFKITYVLQYLSNMTLDAYALTQTPSRLLHHLAFKYHIKNTHLYVFFEVKNLTDRQRGSIVVAGLSKTITVNDVDFRAYPLPGRIFFFGLVYNLDQEAKL